MKTTTLLSTSLLLSLAVLPAVGRGQAQAPATSPTPVPVVQPPAEPTVPMPAALAWEPPPLQPFSATYQAFYKGKEAGDASMQVTHTGGSQWRVDMQVVGRRGFASVLGLNIEQSTVFEERSGIYAPLSQSTVRKGLFLGKKAVGTYNWQAGTAQWTGDVKKERAQPIPLQAGDQSALLILQGKSDTDSISRLGYNCAQGLNSQEARFKCWNLQDQLILISYGILD